MFVARPLCIALLLLTSCGGPLESIAFTDRSAFFRCFPSIRPTLCPDGRSTCSADQQRAYAAMPDYARKRWLASHGCTRDVVFAEGRGRPRDGVAIRPGTRAEPELRVTATSVRGRFALVFQGMLVSGVQSGRLSLSHVVSQPSAASCRTLEVHIDGGVGRLPYDRPPYVRPAVEGVASPIPIDVLNRMADARDVRIRMCDEEISLDDRQFAMLREFVDTFRRELARLPPPGPDIVGTVTVTMVKSLADVAPGATCTLRVRAEPTPDTCRASLVCGDALVYGRADHPGVIDCMTFSLSPAAAVGSEREGSTDDGSPMLSFDSTTGTLQASDDEYGAFPLFSLTGQLVFANSDH